MSSFAELLAAKAKAKEKRLAAQHELDTSSSPADNIKRAQICENEEDYSKVCPFF